MYFQIERAYQMSLQNFYRDPFLDPLYRNSSTSVLKKGPEGFQSGGKKKQVDYKKNYSKTSLRLHLSHTDAQQH